MGLCLVITYMLNLFDLAATTLWVNSFGLSVEGNPLGRWLYEQGLVYPVKVLLVGGLLVILYFALKVCPRWQWVSRLLLGAYGLLAVYHVAGAIVMARM